MSSNARDTGQSVLADWTGNGGCEVEIFTGSNARRQARQYIEQRPATFEEIRLEAARLTVRLSGARG